MENWLKIEEMHEKYTACPIQSLEFQSELPISDRKYRIPIGNPVFRFDFSIFYFIFIINFFNQNNKEK